MTPPKHEPCVEVLVVHEMLAQFVETQRRLQDTLEEMKAFFIGSPEHPTSGIVHELGLTNRNLGALEKRIEVLERRQLHRLIPNTCKLVSDMLRNVWPVILMAATALYGAWEWLKHGGR